MYETGAIKIRLAFYLTLDDLEQAGYRIHSLVKTR